MTPSSLASVATEALAAVTSSISSYFQKKGRFSQEFFIPATAFVLACLAVVMAILGPGAPQVWWAGLTGEIKALAIALFLLTLVIVAEASKPLTLLVRQLYSGEWPAWHWLQWRRRLPFLSAHLSWQNAQWGFAEADSIFNDLNDQFEKWKTQAQDAPGLPRYPVLTKAVDAYCLISEQDWRSAEAKPVESVITTPADLLGRYALRALKAGEPVRLEDVAPLPDKSNLSEQRRIVAVDFFAGDIADSIAPGLVVTLHVRCHGEQPPCKPIVEKFERLFVLDRAGNRLTVSVAAVDVEQLIGLLPGSRLTVTRDASADLRPLQAVPVVRTGETIRRGQLVLARQIDWAVKTAAEVAALGGILVTEADIVNKLYWPAAATNQLTGGQSFAKSDLKIVPPGTQAAWFIFQTPDGTAQSRLAHRLDLPGPKAKIELDPLLSTANVGGASVLSGNRLMIDYGSPTQEASSLADSAYPIAQGDRVEVSFYKAGDSEPFACEPLCYVHELTRGSHCVISVRDGVAFNDHLNLANKGGKITLNPFVRLPVLTEGHEAYQLIDPAKIATRLFQGRDGVLVDEMCLSEDDVQDCYVVANRSIQPERPIAKAAVKKAVSDSSDWLSLVVQGKKDRFTAKDRRGATLEKPWSEIRRGDLVQVMVNGPSNEVVSLREPELAFVRACSAGPQRIELAVPAWKKPLIEDLWNSKSATVELTLTHADGYLDEDLKSLRVQINDWDTLAPMSKILSGSAAQEATVVQSAKNLKRLVNDLVDFKKRLDQRPWYVKPLDDAEHKTAHEAFWNLQGPLYRAVQRWQETGKALKERREREAARAMPDEGAEVRSTRLGNALAAAADYPEQVYRIDTATILPRLLNVLKPEEGAVTDSVILRLINAEASLNMMLLFSFWSAVWAVLGAAALLFFGGPPWTFPVVLLGGLALSWVTKGAAESQALSYGEALKAVFDLRRHMLLEAIGYQVTYPIAPEEEQQHWRNLNTLFALGVAKGFPKMNKPADQGKGG
ncbi:MAG: hypothetical protein WA040_04450 [Anaerolineae bacterium]